MARRPSRSFEPSRHARPWSTSVLALEHTLGLEYRQWRDPRVFVDRFQPKDVVIMIQITARPFADSFFMYFNYWVPNWAPSELFDLNKLAINLTKYFKIQCCWIAIYRFPMTEWLKLLNGIILQNCRKMDDLEVSIFDLVFGALYPKIASWEFEHVHVGFYRRSVDRRVGQGKSFSRALAPPTFNFKLV